RKENARARQVPARQRNGYREEHHCRARRSAGREVAGQGQVTVSGDDGKIRIIPSTLPLLRQLPFCGQVYLARFLFLEVGNFLHGRRVSLELRRVVVMWEGCLYSKYFVCFDVVYVEV